MNEPKQAAASADPSHPVLRQHAARRSTLVSVGVNLMLTVGQGIAGIVAGSQALVADAVHSLSDLLSDFIVLFAGYHGSKGPDEDHQYGHQRFETAASLALGVLLCAVGVGMLWNAAGKVETAQAGPAVGVMALWVALGTLLAKELLFRYLLAVAQRVRSSMLAANAWHSRSDAASSLVVALGIGGNLLGYRWLDPVAAMIVGLMILRMGWRFGWNAMQDLMDRGADADTMEAIRRSMLDTPGVLGVHDLKTRKMGDLILVDVHLEMDALLTVEQGHAIAMEARRRAMQNRDVLDVMTHMDPVRRPGAAPARG